MIIGEEEMKNERQLLTVEDGPLMQGRESVRYLILHCSATRCDKDYTAEQLLRDHKTRGFRTVGYHFYIRRDGTITQHRKLLEVGAHCRPWILNQTLKELEIILVDDGSPDNCPALCDEYAQKDARIKVIHKKNEGLGFARNAGLNLASGKFVSFLDSDDWVAPAMYEALYRVAEKMKCDTVYCSLQYYYSKDKIIPFEEVGQEVFFRGRKSVDSFLLDMLAPLPSYRSDVKYMVSVCKAIYLRKIIEDNQLRFVSEKVVASEDMFFHVRYLKLAENVGFIPEYFYNYFQNECSITHTYTEDKIERLKRFIQEMHSVFAEYFAEEDYWVRLQRKALHYLRNSLYIKYQIVKKKSFSIQNYELKQICKDAFFYHYLNNYPYQLLPMKHRLFYLLVKYRATLLLLLVYKLNKK